MVYSAMLSALGLALFGFLLGVRHAVDPDHVVAVTAIATGHRAIGRATLVGALWGVGHTVTILLVGGVIILFRITIPPRLGLAFEFAVGLVLIVLGFANLLSRDTQAPRQSTARPLIVGMVHGLAGSAAVALLVLAAVRDPRWAVAYLLLFGLGTIVGMVAVTSAIAVPASLASGRVPAMRRYLVLVSGAASVAFGVMLAVELVRSGLFSASPVWTPR
jgi:high-affinity nickel-transport protein